MDHLTFILYYVNGQLKKIATIGDRFEFIFIGLPSTDHILKKSRLIEEL